MRANNNKTIKNYNQFDQLCKNYMDEYCQRGQECKYIHDEQACKFYFFDGNCLNKKCSYRHEFTLGALKQLNKKEQNAQQQYQPKSAQKEEKPIPENNKNLNNLNKQNDVTKQPNNFNNPQQTHQQNNQIQYRRKDQPQNNNQVVQNEAKQNNNNSKSNNNKNEKNANNNNNNNNNNKNNNNININKKHNNNHKNSKQETELDYINYRKLKGNTEDIHFQNDQQYALTKAEIEKESKYYKAKQPVNNNSNNIYQNTTSFEPTYEPADLKVRMAHYNVQNKNKKHYNYPIESRDIIIVPNLFFEDDDNFKLFNALLEEVDNDGNEDHWKLWHGDNHLIADDKAITRQNSPVFNMVVEKMQNYFNMDIKATRFNWYRDSSEWKPFHHDAAAVKPDKAKTQNFTIGVSFGAERDLAFEHAKTKNTVTFPMPNGTVCAFSKDVNIQWRHGVPQIPPSQRNKMGRISIIAWGWVKDMIDV